MATPTLLDDLQRALAQANIGRLSVAFSGGLDSSVLLHLLSRCERARELRLQALHVDHGIHPDSEHWAARCGVFAKDLDVPIRQLRCAVDRSSGRGLESAAREARYAALAELLAEGDWLATAHHQDDQAETLLLRLLRGSASRGLAAMRVARPLGDAVLWRPLLNWPRAELQRYAEANSLRWIDDPANLDWQHDRTWLREKILPQLRQRWPTASAAIGASATLLGDESDRLDALDRHTVDAMINPDHSLPIDALLALGAVERASALRCWLRQLSADPLPRHLHAQLDRDLLAAADDATPELRWGQSRLRRYRNALSLAPKADPSTAAAGTPESEPLLWDGQDPLDWPAGGQLSIQPAWTGPPIKVSRRIGGERIQLAGRQHSQSLKKLLQSHGVPPWEREQMPLLWSIQGELLAAGDRLLSQAMQQWLAVSDSQLTWAR